jgi:pyruvate dehydrogenase E1 component beta subunit
MAKTVAETIKQITHEHLSDNNSLLFGQAIKAVGWVNNTVPDCKNIVELPMSDVSNMGIACGAAIAGRRPIIIIRFQDFMWLNSSTLVNYAAKSKDILGTSTPIFVRALAQENAGCVHSGVLHSIFMHMPGFRICSPMTPKEYHEAWDDFMVHDDPMIVSEHRVSFNNKDEFVNSDMSADITLMPISSARFNIKEAISRLDSEDIKCNVAHIMWLKPLKKEHLLSALANSEAGLVVDATFEACSAARSIAYELMLETGKPVAVLGLEERSVGVSLDSRNSTPSVDKIVTAAKDILCYSN